MKKLIIFAVLFVAAFSLQAQKDKEIMEVEEVQTLVNKITAISGKKLDKNVKSQQITDLVEDFIVSNPDAIRKVRTKKALKGKPLSAEKMKQYQKLHREADALINSDAKKPMARGGADAASDEAWASYWDWYQRSPQRLDKVSNLGGYLMVTRDDLKVYQEETKCKNYPKCMTEEFLFDAKPINKIAGASGGSLDADR